MLELLWRTRARRISQSVNRELSLHAAQAEETEELTARAFVPLRNGIVEYLTRDDPDDGMASFSRKMQEAERSPEPVACGAASEHARVDLVSGSIATALPISYGNSRMRSCLAESSCKNAERPSWTIVFFLTVCAWLLLGAITLLSLHFTGRLVAPPLVGTSCIDEKLNLLRTRNLANIRTMAIGSSVTWRNLDMASFGLAPSEAINAAPCLLHVHQTSFLAEMLADMMPKLRNVVTVVAPRDFASCEPEERQIFDPALGRGFLNGQIPSWMPYLVNMRSFYFIRNVRRLPEQRRTLLAFDEYGSSPLLKPNSLQPGLSFDERCFTAFRSYAKLMAARKIHLVVATLPVMEGWSKKLDPSGAIIERWTNRIIAALGDRATFVDGRAVTFGDNQFADPMHLLAPHHRDFSKHVFATGFSEAAR